MSGVWERSKQTVIILFDSEAFEMTFCITKEELEKALSLINIAIESGFKDSLAVLKIYTGGETITDFLAKSPGTVILKAHPTDGSKNWGQLDPSWFEYENGKCIVKER
jgi:hypothetical protein